MSSISVIPKRIGGIRRPQVDYVKVDSDFRKGYHQRLKTESENIHSYIGKEVTDLASHGKIFTGGYVRSQILADFGIKPENIDNNIVLHEANKISEGSIKKYGTYYKNSSTHCMFSLAKPTTDKLESAGINVDKFLVELTRKVMNDFGRKFYPNDPIGYVFGVHHDTAYRHVHVALLSRTLNGQGVSCSSSKDKGHESAKNRVERWDYVHERVNHLVQMELKDSGTRVRAQEQREIEKRISQEREENERLRDKVWQELTRIQASSNELYLKRQRLLAQREESDRHYARLADIARTENRVYQERLDQYFNELGTVKKSKEQIYFRLSNMASYGRPLGDLLSLVKQPLSSSAELKKLIASAQQSKFICASNLRILTTQRNAAREAIDFDINEVNNKISRDRKLI